jgi:hypothetical protein
MLAGFIVRSPEKQIVAQPDEMEAAWSLAFGQHYRVGGQDSDGATDRIA